MDNSNNEDKTRTTKLISSSLKFMIIIIVLYFTAVNVDKFTKSKIQSYNKRVTENLREEINSEKDKLGIDKISNDPVKDAVYNEYALYLINNNDNLIKLELESTDLYDKYIKYIEDGNKYSQSDSFWINTTNQMSDIIIKHASILKDLKELSPDESNADYNKLYNMILEGHLYMSQGMILQLEHLYELNNQAKKNDAEKILNIVGNIVLELGPEVNYIRKTNHIIKYRSKKDKPIIKEEYKDDFYDKLIDSLNLDNDLNKGIDGK